MPKPLRVLIAEDSEDDALLLVRELRRGDWEPSHLRVENSAQMRAALKDRAWDMAVSDWQMPQFDALAALAIVQELCPDLPFLIVSGSIDDEMAVRAMRAGAHDFLTKGRLARLLPAIERELREAALRQERRKMQDQLLFSDRMVSMGTLAAGVAHEINNPLASVIANLDLAARAVADQADRLGLGAELQEVKEELQDAREAADRIRSIVRDLKIFSRAEEPTKGVVDVHRVMESTLRMAWNEVRHRARLVKSYGKVPPVEATDSRLGQVFLNLVINAAQAIAEGHCEDNEIRVSTGTDPAGRALVEIADTGQGMPPEVLARVFTPFFTTKPVGVGTGLGLSICQRIIHELGGSIEVHSEVGKGTSFRIALPPGPNAPSAESGAGYSQATAARRRGRVLVVDDEPFIVRVVGRTLAAHHEVVAATRAEEALGRVLRGERFDVILCDLMMPQMSGMELHAELRRVAPEQAERVVFLTGGAFTPRARAFLDATTNLRIEKPFDPVQLAALVNDRVR